MSNGKAFMVFEKDPSRRLGWITFSRPEKLNMFTVPEMEEFGATLRRIETDDEVKVLILKGAGEHFGAGIDMMAVAEGVSSESDRSVKKTLLDGRRMAHEAHQGLICNAFHFIKPIIAQVQGYCYGQHFVIATGCDMVVASDDALFTHPAFRYTVETWPMAVWWDMLGPHGVAEMVFTGRPFTASEMLQYRFVNKVVPRGKLEEATNEIAQVIALQNIDVLMLYKHYLETVRASRNDLVGPNMVGCLAHSLSNFIKPETSDFSVSKETTRGGPQGAISKREDRYPPEYRLSRSRRVEKQ